jgi:hypothetical protein
LLTCFYLNCQIEFYVKTTKLKAYKLINQSIKIF